MNIRLPEGSAAPIGFNASNPSLINILLQQAAKSKEKKRPTFEEVFAKLNARSVKMNANKNPINNMLTNEQLFRYYVKDTEPKLRVSDESFNVEDALNPMKESDPTKIYGSGATQTSDIIPSRNPYNNAMNIGYQDPLQAQAEALARAAAKSNKPISGKLSTLIQQARIPTPATAPAPDEQVPTYFPEPIVLGEADNNYRDALAISNRLELANYDNIRSEAEMLLKIFFSGDYVDQSTYFMKMLIDGGGGGLENAVSGLYDIFYQVRLNKPTNDFMTNRIKDIVGSMVIQSEFDKLYNPNNVSQQEFLQNIAKKINTGSFFQPTEMARMDRELALIDRVSLGDTVGEYLNNTEKTYYDLYGKSAVRNATTGDPTDPFEAFNQAAAEGPNIVNSLFNDLLDEMFYDGDTEIRSNTDINSIELDPELAKKLADRNMSGASTQPAESPGFFSSIFGSRKPPDSSISSTTAEAGSPAGINIEDVRRRKPGVQPGTTRGPYNTPKKMSQDILGDIIGGAVDIAEAKPKKKK